MTILVAEDNETDFYFLQCMLRKVPMAAVFRVSDGDEAMRYLKGDGRFSDRSAFPLPDILLVDLRLPKISGHDILSWLRGQAAFRQLRKYVLSGSDIEMDRERALQAGAHDYFVKPLSLGHLAALFNPSARAEAERATGSLRARGSV